MPNTNLGQNRGRQVVGDVVKRLSVDDAPVLSPLDSICRRVTASALAERGLSCGCHGPWKSRAAEEREELVDDVSATSRTIAASVRTMERRSCFFGARLEWLGPCVGLQLDLADRFFVDMASDSGTSSFSATRRQNQRSVTSEIGTRAVPAAITLADDAEHVGETRPC